MKRVFGILIILLAVASYSGAERVPQGLSPFPDIEPMTGTPAPDFFLRDMKRKGVSLTALRGNVVILHFWATWCPQCKEEIQFLNILNDQYRGKNVKVIGISADPSEARVEEFIMFNPIDYTILLDRDGSVGRKYRVYSIPTTFLIDKEGFIVERYFIVDSRTLLDLRLRINSLLSE